MSRIISNRFALPAKPVHEGGHSKLFKATDLDRDHEIVAVKVFSPSRSLDDRVLKAAWTNELSTYQALGDHDNLARLIDWGRCDDGSPYLAFEWLERDLLDNLTNLHLEGWDDFWPIGLDILTGLESIHSAGFVHRDLKPENVLVGANGRYKVADFGTTRLVETVNLGLTMAPLGTVPYAPPERGTGSPTPAYDVYSFAVLATVCLSGRVPVDEDRVAAAFHDLDLPPKVAEVLAECLATEIESRPGSAGVLLARLREIQVERETRRQPTLEVFIDLPESTLQLYKKQYGLATSREDVIEDLSGVLAFAFDHRPGADQDLQIAGQTLELRTQPHRTRPGVLRVLRISRPPAHVLEYARSNWLRPKAKLRLTTPTNPSAADALLKDLLTLVSENDAARASMEVAAQEEEVFSSWRATLNAKFALENERGADLRYDGFQPNGNRINFHVKDGAVPEIGEGRLIRNGRRRILFGEVEGVENGELILYVTRRTADALPRKGVLEFDTEASKSKLRREQAALDRIVARKSVRNDLRDLLVEPSKSSQPQPVEVREFVQGDLDQAKREAVEASLGSRDFVLVEGPPGTGKTTFIAELVAQHLALNPTGRILLASQTHIALDNALMRIQAIAPSVVLLRLGFSEKFAQDVEPLSVQAQMERWKVSVLQQSKEFIKSYASRLGIDLESADIKGLAVELDAHRERLRMIRSRIAHSQAEKKALADQLSAVSGLAGPVLEIAAQMDAAVRGNAASELASAAERFIETGMQLAAKLEAGGALNDKLVALEATLAERRTELQEQVKLEEKVKSSLASALGLASAAKTDELLAAARARPDASDPRLQALQRVAADWEERFGRSRDFEAALISRADVVAATCVGFAGAPGSEATPFDLCIIDEASKATSTETLVPLAGSRRWVIVGDDRQLPPFADHALESKTLLSRFDLTREQVRETLFSVLSERLPESCRFSLTHQHRMHPVIGGLVSQCFYQGRLSSEARDLDPVISMAFGSAVVWVDTSGRSDKAEGRAGTSFRNKGEARVIARLLDRLQWVADQRERTFKVAVLTGYEAQRLEITETIASGELQRGRLDVRVATVDSYQGQEADVAIFSLVRSNSSSELGFLSSEQRINVALSRARESLILVGDVKFVESVPDQVRNPLFRVLSYVRKAEGCSIEKADS